MFLSNRIPIFWIYNAGSVRPKREKLVSAEYRIFGRIFGRIAALKLTIFDYNFGQNSSQFKMGKIQSKMLPFDFN